eukprot:scaffold13547_cov50-Cyclotella_meneghiniana.AAC.1
MYDGTRFDSFLVPGGMSLKIRRNNSREVGRQADAESIYLWMTIDQEDTIHNQLCTAVNRDQNDSKSESKCCYS